jgi:hypothetical protein
VIVCFIAFGGIADHHCLEVIVCFIVIGGIVDRLSSDDQTIHQYQQKEQSSINSDGQQLHQ